MSVKRRDEAAGMVLRFATEQLPDVELVFYRSPPSWENEHKGMCIYVGREDGLGEYHSVSASDQQLKERPGSTLLPLVRGVCQTLGKASGDEPPAKASPPKGRKKSKAS